MNLREIISNRPTCFWNTFRSRIAPILTAAAIALPACGRDPMGDGYAGGSGGAETAESDSTHGESYTSFNEGLGSDAATESETPLPPPRMWDYDIDCPGYTHPNYGCRAGHTYDFTFLAQFAEECRVILNYPDEEGLSEERVTEAILDPPLGSQEPDAEQSAIAPIFTAGQSGNQAYITVFCQNSTGSTSSNPLTLDYQD